MKQFKKYLIKVDKNMNVLNAEEAFLAHVGRTTIKNLDQVVPPQDMMQLMNAVFAIDPGSRALTCFRLRTESGRLNWIAANVEKQNDEDENINMELSDIQTLKTEGAMAQLDDMTGLMNKQAITNYAMELTQEYPRKHFYFCLMDIDHFKSVNDTFGHMCGDEVIIDVAHIISECVGNSGVVGRIGGDEFMLVLENVDNKPKAREVLSKVRETVETKYKQFRDTLDITVSIGSAFYPDYAVDYDALFKLTDKMLYLAKMKGRNRYIIYTPEIHGDVNAEPKVNTTTFHAASGSSKMQLMMNLMSKFLHQTDITIQMAIEQILAAYDLDEIFIFFQNLEKSKYGISRVELEGGKFRIENVENSMPFLESEHFQELFNQNHIAVANIFDLNREKFGDVVSYMERNERRFMVVYRMTDTRKPGYLVYINKRENSARLSESDIADLIYFGRMLELTSSVR